ncbi:hypothetical protein F2P81_013633 [Scophthalmus maximus]|uniref:Uncharacterized protein n=1 Tax=Scophthalmus maximus TaxID=52904 RepID=A0A6A4SK04_SCOMX|nr:hypothetical protein F2P81_013633 [Scophthalmus maximus]
MGKTSACLAGELCGSPANIAEQFLQSPEMPAASASAFTWLNTDYMEASSLKVVVVFQIVNKLTAGLERSVSREAKLPSVKEESQTQSSLTPLNTNGNGVADKLNGKAQQIKFF